MATVYRRTYWATNKRGERVKRKCNAYTVKWRTPNGVYHVVRGYTDRDASKQLGARLEREAARGIEGLEDPHKDYKARPLTAHLEEYLADLEATEHSAGTCYGIEKGMLKLFAACEWKTLADIEPNGFTAWRARQKKLAAKTLNEYLDTVRAFVKWCIIQKRTATNPLAEIPKVDARGKQKRRRRALTLDELDALLLAAQETTVRHRPGGACSYRPLYYKTAFYAQLRRNDIDTLRWADVRLDVLPPCLITRPETSKSKRLGKHPLPTRLADELRTFRPADARETDPVFPNPPSYKMFNSDLKRARIDKYDEQGRVVDFHAMGRTTPNTMMASAGVELQTRMAMMRHTDVRLTSSTYMDETLLDRSVAVGKLPDLGVDRPDPEPIPMQATGTDDATPDPLHQILHQTTGRKRGTLTSADTAAADPAGEGGACKSCGKGTLDTTPVPAGVGGHRGGDSGLPGLEPGTF